MSKDNQEIILITRADDMGYTHTGNVATIECMRNGIIRSAAILVIAPWFEEAAKLTRDNPDLCFGVHLGLIGEWRGYRWRPVLPYSAVPSLVDEDGFLWQSPRDFWGHHPDMAEVEKEFTAQIELAKKKGVQISYIDTHYVMPYNEHYSPCWSASERSTGSRFPACSASANWMTSASTPCLPRRRKRRWSRCCEGLKPGVNLLIGHPGLSSLENDALVHFEPEHVQVLGTGRLRAAETLAYTSPRIKRLVKELGIKLMSYAEFCQR